MSSCMELKPKDFWWVAVSLKNLSLHDGEARVSLNVTQPNGYRQSMERAVEIQDGGVEFDVLYPLLDDGQWEGPEKAGTTEDFTPEWDKRWIQGDYIFTACFEQQGVSPQAISTRLDVYDFYRVRSGDPPATHSDRQFLECSPSRPIYIDADHAAFHVCTVPDRVSECELEADVVLAGTDEPLAGPWRMCVDGRRSQKTFSTKGWGRADYWIRLRVLHDGEPVGAYCVRLFTKEASNSLQLSTSTMPSTPMDLGTGTVFLTDETFFESVENIRFCPDPAPRVPDRPLIESDRPWELDGLSVHEISYDEERQEFRLIYRTSTYRPERAEEAAALRFADLLAVSKDGLEWEKPNLGRVEFQGSKANNILSNAPTKYLSGKFGENSEEARRAIENANFRFYDPDRDGPIDLSEILIPAWKRGFPEECQRIIEARAIPEHPEGDSIFRGRPRGYSPMIERDGDFVVLTREPIMYGGVGQNLWHCTETVRGHANLDGSQRLFYFFRPTPPGYPPHWAPSDNLCHARRCIAVLWTNDGFTWERRFALSPDEFDVDGTVYYAMCAIGPIGSKLVGKEAPTGFKRSLYPQCALAKSPMYLGSVLHYELWSGRLWHELTWSRDLIRWHRFTKERHPFIELTTPGTYCGGWARAQDAQAYQFGEEWWFPFSASPSLHYSGKASSFKGSLDQFKKRFSHYKDMSGFETWEEVFEQRESFRTYPAMARCKIGRLAHAEPVDTIAHLTSRRLLAGENGIVINAAVEGGGSVRMEVRDGANVVIPGYALSDCVPFSGDDTAHTVTWKSRDREHLVGRAVQLHFALDRAKLYTFRFAH